VYAIWRFGELMAALPKTRPLLQRPDRRSFLWSLAGLGLTTKSRTVSDIQAFGYNPDDDEQTASDPNLLAVWYLVRQDLYLNDQATAFLIVHWKHTLNFIRLLDVIPGDGTELISE
jgi:hypothetical protein